MCLRARNMAGKVSLKRLAILRIFMHNLTDLLFFMSRNVVIALVSMCEHHLPEFTSMF